MFTKHSHNEQSYKVSCTKAQQDSGQRLSLCDNPLILGTIITDALYRNLHGPVNKIEEYFLHDFNGRQMWSNGFIKIFRSNNVFIFHSSTDG